MQTASVKKCNSKLVLKRLVGWSESTLWRSPDNETNSNTTHNKFSSMHRHSDIAMNILRARTHKTVNEMMFALTYRCVQMAQTSLHLRYCSNSTRTAKQIMLKYSIFSREYVLVNLSMWEVSWKQRYSGAQPFPSSVNCQGLVWNTANTMYVFVETHQTGDISSRNKRTLSHVGLRYFCSYAVP